MSEIVEAIKTLNWTYLKWIEAENKVAAVTALVSQTDCKKYGRRSDEVIDAIRKTLSVEVEEEQE
jgi:hypothetical protein